MTLLKIDKDRRTNKDRRTKPEPGRRTEGFSPQMVCVLLDIHINTLYSWVKKGYIRAYKIGPHLLRIPRSEIGRMRRVREETAHLEGKKRYYPADSADSPDEARHNPPQ